MKGLTPHQLVEITDFVQKYHGFYNVADSGYLIKYIDACYDSRQGDYWSISFRGFGSIHFSTNSHNFGFSSLYDWVMAYLKKEWLPKKGEEKYVYFDDKPLTNSFPNGILELNWTDIDMIEAYCADLEDRNSDDTQAALEWINKYKQAKQH